MSLISINNFAAPFKSNTHVITLILVAALFGAYRYSGGSISGAPRSNQALPPPIVDYSDSEEVVSPSVEQEGQNRREVLDQLRAKGGSNKVGGNKHSLDEIEQQLGLK